MENTQFSLGAFHAAAKEQKQARNSTITSTSSLHIFGPCVDVWVWSEGGGTQANHADIDLTAGYTVQQPKRVELLFFYVFVYIF